MKRIQRGLAKRAAQEQERSKNATALKMSTIDSKESKAKNQLPEDLESPELGMKKQLIQANIQDSRTTAAQEGHRTHSSLAPTATQDATNRSGTLKLADLKGKLYGQAHMLTSKAAPAKREMHSPR